MKKTKPGPVAVEQIKLADLIPQARNARTHSDAQVAQIAASIREFGFTNPVLIDTQGTIIAGHGRVMAARKLSLESVPCLRLGHLTPEQVRAYVIADNKLALNAGWNEEALKAELDAILKDGFDVGLVGFSDAELAKLLETSHETLPDTEDAEPEEQPQTGIHAFREDAILPSSNQWGIPDIREDMLLSDPPSDVWVNQPHGDSVWLYMHGSNKHPEGMRSIRAFYVDDYRFERIWNDAVAFIFDMQKVGHVGLLEPDFSLWSDMPVAVQLYNVFRSRWCARYWQEAGFKIIPSLKWATEASYPFSTAGLPKRVPLASVQCRTTNNGKANTKFLAGLRHQLEAVEIDTLMVYGGQEHPRLFDGLKCKTILLPSWTSRRNQLRKIESTR